MDCAYLGAGRLHPFLVISGDGWGEKAGCPAPAWPSLFLDEPPPTGQTEAPQTTRVRSQPACLL